MPEPSGPDNSTPYPPSGALYRLGAALRDRDVPSKVTNRGSDWIFGPEEPYERVGDVGDVVFPCGTVIPPGTDELRIYYGAADTSVGMAVAKVGDLLDWVKRG